MIDIISLTIGIAALVISLLNNIKHLKSKCCSINELEIDTRTPTNDKTALLFNDGLKKMGGN